MHFSSVRYMKTLYFIGFLLVPFLGFSDFDNDDKNRLGAIASNVQTIESNLINNGSFTINPLQSIQYLYRDFTTAFLTSSPSWGGHFIKTVGNAAAKFTQEFGTNGWFPAVKASIGVIQADVGRINTALTTVNDHLEIIEGDVSSIKDNTESINTSVESIDSTVSSIDSTVSSIDSTVSSIDSNISSILPSFSSYIDLFNKPYSIPTKSYFLYTPNSSSFTPGSVSESNKQLKYTPYFSYQIFSSHSYNNAIDAIIHSSDLLMDISAVNNKILAQQWVKLHGVFTSVNVATNLLQKILDTNDVWYAKIYDRIPTNLTVVVSNIASNASNDWRYTAATALSSAPVLQDLTPSRDRDVNQSFALAPPQLTGDFKADVILLLGNMQQIAASSASVDLDILTNVQVVAESILSASAAVGQKIDAERQNAQDIASDGQSHEHDLDSAEQYFKIKDSNNDAAINLQNASLLPSKLSPLVVSYLPGNYSLDVPAFSVFGSGSADSLQINMNLSRFQGYFDNIRNCFALFWFVFAFLIVWKLFILGIRMLGWISSLINPFSFNAGTQGHDLSSFYG